MKISRQLTAFLQRAGLVGAMLFAGSISTPAFAGIDVEIGIGLPPPPRVEVVPVVPEGYVWAPGYWQFFQGQYVWRRGHFMEGRPGYRWVPENWERHDGYHHFNEGHWDRDNEYRGWHDHDHGDHDHGDHDHGDHDHGDHDHGDHDHGDHDHGDHGHHDHDR